MKDIFELTDDLGPTKIIHVYEPSVSLKAVLVVDNVAKGPSIGGVRMAIDVSTYECFRLARAMTLKNAAAGIPHGGGKVVLYGNPKMPKKEKELLVRALACSLRDVKEYIFAPDMGIDEECMAWVKDEIGRAVALPREIGGIPLDEIGATGWGICHVADIALNYCDFELEGASIVVQGFGSVGKHAAHFLTERGAILIGAADSQGAIHNPNGLDVKTLIEIKKAGNSVREYHDGKKLDRDEVIDIECDIWIPAARPDVINKDNMHRLNTRLVIEGANIPITHEAEEHLYNKGVLYVPDFIANAGGVICAAMEYQGACESVAFQVIKEKLTQNTMQVLEESSNKKIHPRVAAMQLALHHVKRAMDCRRWSLFSSAQAFL